MKKRYAYAAAAVILAGCAGLQFSEVSQRFSEFHPTSVAILPFTNTMGMENANEATNNSMLSAINKAKLFDHVVDPGQVKQAMGTSDELVTAVTNLHSKWAATGLPDKNLSAMICKTLNCDSIMFGEITQWGKQTSGLQTFCRAGVAIRWVDKSGEVLWKAAHSVENQGMFASIEGSMSQVINAIVNAWPKHQA